ncbi:cation:proton antiporter [Aliikangiella maris]|uniref:Cation:proton antiporter n=2 Tax=Aliikangiella maris TaxID=3162458 RepID=A0ABV2BSC0_9GAMM
MDFIWILFAFVFGAFAKFIKLPPLIGYLVAGFLLHVIDIEAGDNLKLLSDLGITLMLFTIGLKLNLGELLRKEVWIGTLSNMLLWIILVSVMLVALASYLSSSVWQLSLSQTSIIAFALSFSSTVCVVKILEESGELKLKHSKIAIAILVMQDIVAVVFMVIATGALPSIWAIGLFALFFFKPALNYLLDKMGHGELLPLMGFFLALGTYELFDLVGIKGDLGALVAGVLLSGHAKATELYKSLMSFKDLFLIGFFLSIGFIALPNMEMTLIALLLTLVMPIKSLVYFFVFARLRLRARTAYLSSLVLSNYSEFGLIVIALCISQNIIEKEWLVILAMSVSFSFVLTSVFYRNAHHLYTKYNDFIRRFEDESLLNEKAVVIPDNIEILVIGMGRVGRGTYHSLTDNSDAKVWGMDADLERVNLLKSQNCQIFFADGEDADFWRHIPLQHLKLILVALPNIQDIKNINEQLKVVGYQGKVAAVARYDDQIESLQGCQLDKIYNFYTEVGVGFARESLALLNDEKTI